VEGSLEEAEKAHDEVDGWGRTVGRPLQIKLSVVHGLPQSNIGVTVENAISPIETVNLPQSRAKKRGSRHRLGGSTQTLNINSTTKSTRFALAAVTN
jgi:hypothetical protein